MLDLIVILILLSVCIQLMAVVDNHKRFEKLERNVAEIINNEFKVNRDKHNYIELKNIDLTGVTYTEQLKKIKEEDREFFNAISNGTCYNITEEIWDTFQARMGLAYMEDVTAKDIMEGYLIHLEKLPYRPRD